MVNFTPGHECLRRMSVGVLSGRGLYDEPITRPGESYRLWRIIVCGLETSRLWSPWAALGCGDTGEHTSGFDEKLLYSVLRYCKGKR